MSAKRRREKKTRKEEVRKELWLWESWFYTARIHKRTGEIVPQVNRAGYRFANTHRPLPLMETPPTKEVEEYPTIFIDLGDE